MTRDEARALLQEIVAECAALRAEASTDEEVAAARAHRQDERAAALAVIAAADREPVPVVVAEVTL